MQGRLKDLPPLSLPLHLDGCVSAFEYDCPIGHAIRNLKYSRKTYLADILGDLLPFDETIPAEWIIPVPLHPKRLSKRGFNQSELLAEALSRRTGIPVLNDLLERKIHTDPQAGLSGKERRNNLKGAFSCKKSLPAETVILVDDVITTGSTLSACAEALKKSGIQKVYACTVASAVE